MMKILTHSSLLLTLVLILTLTLTLTHSSSHPNPNLNPNPKCNLPQDKTSTLQILHTYNQCSPLFNPNKLSWDQQVTQILTQDTTRIQYLSSHVARKSVAPIAWGRQVIQSPSYLVRVKVGTPPQIFFMTLDTSYVSSWLPCANKSSSFKGVPCGTPQCNMVTTSSCLGNSCTFNQTYRGSTISASVSQDTISLAQDPIPGYIFGCTQKAETPQGLLGLGRGPLSLLDQTQSLYKSTFSYCLPSFSSTNFSGSLRLGPVAQPKKAQFTPLLKNPRRPSLYYVNLVGIKVGRKSLDISPSALAFNPTTGSGTIIDSGTVYTRLVTPAYTAVRDEFRRVMGKATVTSLGGFDTCYTVPITVPTITFVFQELNVTITQDNFVLRSASTPTACLAMAAATDNLNVIGNMQQQNHRVVFDVPNSRIGISREPCS